MATSIECTKKGNFTFTFWAREEGVRVFFYKISNTLLEILRA